MIEKNDRLPANTVASGDFTIETARAYRAKSHHGRRFARRYRIRRLERFEKRFSQRLFDMVGNDAHIVDIPCGNGRFFEIFSKAKRFSMADYSINMLKAAEEKLGTHENVRLIEADISSIPLPDASAELCFCMRLFHHMKNDQVRLAALNELARVSNKYVALSFYNKNCPRYYWRKTLGKKIRGHYVTVAHIDSLAKQVGLELVARSPKMNLFEQQCLVLFRKDRSN